jgi:hypothetical protein
VSRPCSHLAVSLVEQLLGRQLLGLRLLKRQLPWLLLVQLLPCWMGVLTKVCGCYWIVPLLRAV